jgi:hypothetical protein
MLRGRYSMMAMAPEKGSAVIHRGKKGYRVMGRLFRHGHEVGTGFSIIHRGQKRCRRRGRQFKDGHEVGRGFSLSYKGHKKQNFF